jgi:hypothetical protein
MPDLPGEQRHGGISGLKSPDLGILSESSDEGVTDSGSNDSHYIPKNRTIINAGEFSKPQDR